MQYGFVIDHSKCIGCHACTVACKSENAVPVGSFRTWVKYTETGSFPTVKRNFAVLRCNQCSAAPCVTICPVGALEKRDDGIVDVDPARCIGCKACMQGCPYDALYINDDTGTAEKCHFCAHRVEQNLAPACAVVCPTEAIIPGDFSDPGSLVSQMKSTGELTARKIEAGTGPNVWYKEAAAEGLDPSQTNRAGGYLWSNQQPGVQLDAQEFEALEQKAQSRTTYDVEHPPLWGGKVSAYLFTKSLAAGAMMAGLLQLSPFGFLESGSQAVMPAVGLFFLMVTAVLLIADLKRPERFWYILRYANWNSWLAKGAIVLGAYGALLALWLMEAWIPILPAGIHEAVWVLTWIAAGLTAAYTGWLFNQAKGRALWLSSLLWLELLVHALVAGMALVLISGSGGPDAARVFLAAIALHILLGQLAPKFVPKARKAEFHRAHRLTTAGPFAMRRRAVLIGFLVCLPILFSPPAAHPMAAALALVLLYMEEDMLVRAGQALPIH